MSSLTALLFAVASLADPQVRDGSLLWFNLNETMTEVARKLGPPKLTADAGNGTKSWQYHLASGDDHELPSHYLLFGSDGKLASITRVYDPEQPMDALFPAGETSTHFMPGNSYGARVRRLSGGRVLVAPGSTKPGQPVGQLVLMHESDLHSQYPWIVYRGTDAK